MDPKKLFMDERLKGFCAFCGGLPETRDHVPSKIFLDKPFPDNLPVVESCLRCNQSFSPDEEYLACLIERFIQKENLTELGIRDQILGILDSKPRLSSRVDEDLHKGTLGLCQFGDSKRVKNVLIKHVRGHASWDLSEPQMEDPSSFQFLPLPMMSSQMIADFETSPRLEILPEIGSRAFCGVLIVDGELYDAGWRYVQSGRYRYLVATGVSTVVRVVLRELLAVEARWDH